MVVGSIMGLMVKTEEERGNPERYSPPHDSIFFPLHLVNVGCQTHYLPLRRLDSFTGGIWITQDRAIDLDAGLPAWGKVKFLFHGSINCQADKPLVVVFSHNLGKGFTGHSFPVPLFACPFLNPRCRWGGIEVLRQSVNVGCRIHVCYDCLHGRIRLKRPQTDCLTPCPR